MFASMLTVSAPLLLLLATAPSTAPGDHGPHELDARPLPNHVIGGEDVVGCGWPSVVYTSTGNSACTGTLIHPEIVLTAAHCIDSGASTRVRFGSNNLTAITKAEVEYCRWSPGWTGRTGAGEDYGYCKLASPVLDVPIIPVVQGCEASAVQRGATIRHVGFGVDENMESGIKRMMETTIDSITASGELISGDAESIICSGDSGGPTFVYLDPAQGGDGTWRVAAIHSWAQGAGTAECRGQAGSILVTNAIDWIEQDSGVDITPCVNSAGQWEPTWGCQGVSSEPWTASGSHAMGCVHDDLSGFLGTCGPALDETPDLTAPVVSFAAPSDGAEIPSSGGLTPVRIEADASDEGWGIARVTLTLEDVGSGASQSAPLEYGAFVWNTQLPMGTYRLTLVAEDNAGNTSTPAVALVGVGQAPEVPPDPTGTTGTDTTGGASGTDGSTTADPSGGTAGSGTSGGEAGTGGGATGSTSAASGGGGTTAADTDTVPGGSDSAGAASHESARGRRFSASDSRPPLAGLPTPPLFPPPRRRRR